MPAALDDWQDLLEPCGPYRVEHDDGTYVTYGSRGKPRAVNDVAEVRSVADIELVLYDEVGKIVRVITGADVLRFENKNGADGPVIVVVATDTVSPDSGDTVTTRGSHSSY